MKSLGLSDKYLSAFNLGTLQPDFFKEFPFPHAVLPDFFAKDVYEEIRASAYSSWAVDTETSDVGKYGVITHPLVVRRFYGTEFRSFLKSLTGMAVERAQNGYPQLRVISEENHGLSIHNDAGLHYNIGLIYHMTRDWSEDVGGQLKLWQKTEQGRFRLCSVHPPKENTLVLLFLGNNSFHSVEPLKKVHQRVTLIQEWNTCTAPAF